MVDRIGQFRARAALIFPFTLVFACGCHESRISGGAQRFEAFNELVWMNQSRFDLRPSPRFLMADDVLRRRLSMGMHHSRLVRLLGKPSVKLRKNELPDGIPEEAASKITEIEAYPLEEDEPGAESPWTILLVTAFDRNKRLCWAGFGAG